MSRLLKIDYDSEDPVSDRDDGDFSDSDEEEYNDKAEIIKEETESDDEDWKDCNRCNMPQKLSAFPVDNRCRNGRAGICKKCRQIHQKKYYDIIVKCPGCNKKMRRIIMQWHKRNANACEKGLTCD